MDGNIISNVISGAFALVESIGKSIIDLIGRGHPDQTRLAEMKHQYEMAILALSSALQQGELYLKEKLMVGAPWTKPLALTTGFAIVFICVFNAVCRIIGIGKVSVDLATPEILLLIGLFVFVTSGSTEFLFKIIQWLTERLPKKPEDINAKRNKQP